VNRINAATVAAERGIRLHEEKQESQGGGSASVLTIELHTPAGSSQASATVIRGEQPRLLSFDGIDIETPLEGNLLVCSNLDVPGVIGKIGSILGEHGVNIANFALGRERSGKKPVKALALVQVDAPVPEPVLEVLRHIEAVLEARSVQLPEAAALSCLGKNPPARTISVRHRSRWDSGRLLVPFEQLFQCFWQRQDVL
jgi:D-3-phosphoglycerate dehydrogenase